MEESEIKQKEAELRDKAQELTLMIEDFVPTSREKFKAILKVRDAAMWAAEGLKQNK